MTMENQLRQFYQSFSEKDTLGLEPDDDYYVPLWDESPEKDPIEELWGRIDWAESESVHLLTGFRGNGKSTQLRRLKKMLEDRSQCTVFLVNTRDYVLMDKPIEISDFILSLMAALSAAAEEQTKNTNLATLVKDIWDRFTKALTTNINFDTITLKLRAVELGGQLQTDQTFKAQIQKHLKGQLKQFVDEARRFVTELVSKIREQSGKDDLKVVLLVDSLEQMRGVGENAIKVHESVRELFFGQAKNLSFPLLHIVYTVPPYLPVLTPNLGRMLGGHLVTQWPNIHVRKRTGEPDETGLKMMERFVEKRFPAWRNIISQDFMFEFARCSGGYIRNFFGLLRDTAISLRTARKSNDGAVLDRRMVDRVVQQLKNELSLIPEDDAKWLANIHESKEASLSNVKSLPDLARFFDSNWIMNYLNGQPWYDVHPLLVEEIKKITKRISKKEA